MFDVLRCCHFERYQNHRLRFRRRNGWRNGVRFDAAQPALPQRSHIDHTARAACRQRPTAKSLLCQSEKRLLERQPVGPLHPETIIRGGTLIRRRMSASGPLDHHLIRVESQTADDNFLGLNFFLAFPIVIG